MGKEGRRPPPGGAREPLRRPPPSLACLRPPLPAPRWRASPPSAPRLAFPRGGGSEGWGGSSAFPPPSSPLAPVVTRSPRRPRWRPGRVASRDARLGGGSPWRLPGRVLACPGGPRSLGSRGAPRRPPPPAARPGWLSAPSGGGPSPPGPSSCLARLSFLPYPADLLPPFLPPSLQAPGPVRVRLSVSFPASSPNRHPHALARSCPASRRSPPPAGGGLGRGCGGGDGEGWSVPRGRCARK